MVEAVLAFASSGEGDVSVSAQHDGAVTEQEGFRFDPLLIRQHQEGRLGGEQLHHTGRLQGFVGLVFPQGFPAHGVVDRAGEVRHGGVAKQCVQAGGEDIGVGDGGVLGYWLEYVVAFFHGGGQGNTFHPGGGVGGVHTPHPWHGVKGKRATDREQNNHQHGEGDGETLTVFHRRSFAK